jgi:hypothetical protein|tara:strand:- start:60 stop:836 length:777 start_codon:yes stop_codon:yes gene_type:complete
VGLNLGMKEKYLKSSNIKNFKITESICTEVASFYIGDKNYLDKKRKNYDKIDFGDLKQETYQMDTTNEGIIYDEYSKLSKIPSEFNKKLSLKLNLNFFSLSIGGDDCIPIYFFEFNKELDSFFVPLIFPGEYIYWDKDVWNEKNITLKKSIINQFSEEKSKWIKIGKLNIPSKKLLIQEGNFISVEEYYLTYRSKECYDIFAIYSDKDDLYKIYNDPKLSHLDLDQRFTTDMSGLILPKNNPLNFEKILYGLFFKSKN